MVAWDRVTDADVRRATKEYDRLGPEKFFAKHGFAPTTTYELIWEERNYPRKRYSARPMSSRTANDWPLVTSRAARRAPSECSGS